MSKTKLSTPRGFTLVELLTVIGIISLLFAFILGFIDPVMQLKKGRDGVRKSDFRQIQAALEMYRADNGSYPLAVLQSGIYILKPNCPDGDPDAESLGNAPSCSVIYLQKIPKDPQAGTDYRYKSNSPGAKYCIRTCLENTNDSQKDSTNDYADCQGYSFSGVWCTNQGRWSYTLMNP